MGQVGCKQPAAIMGTKRGRGCKEAATIGAGTLFSVNEVEALYELFRQIRTVSPEYPSGAIHKADFQKALFKDRTKSSLMSDRIFQQFDEKKTGAVEFPAFVKHLSVFHPDAKLDDKVECAFKLYDPNGTGHIERSQVKLMLEELLRATNLNLTPQMVDAILDKTFADVKPKVPNKIDRAEWKVMVQKQPSLINNMTLVYLKELTTTFPGFIFTSLQPVDKN